MRRPVKGRCGFAPGCNAVARRARTCTPWVQCCCASGVHVRTVGATLLRARVHVRTWVQRCCASGVHVCTEGATLQHAACARMHPGRNAATTRGMIALRRGYGEVRDRARRTGAGGLGMIGVWIGEQRIRVHLFVMVSSNSFPPPPTQVGLRIRSSRMMRLIAARNLKQSQFPDRSSNCSLHRQPRAVVRHPVAIA